MGEQWASGPIVNFCLFAWDWLRWDCCRRLCLPLFAPGASLMSLECSECVSASGSNWRASIACNCRSTAAANTSTSRHPQPMGSARAGGCGVCGGLQPITRRESDSGQNLGSAACQLPLALPGDRRRIPAPERVAASSNSRKRSSRVRADRSSRVGPAFSSPTPTAIACHRPHCEAQLPQLDEGA